MADKSFKEVLLDIKILYCKYYDIGFVHLVAQI